MALGAAIKTLGVSGVSLEMPLSRWGAGGAGASSAQSRRVPPEAPGRPGITIPSPLMFYGPEIVLKSIKQPWESWESGEGWGMSASHYWCH